MVPFKETINTKQELLDACKKGFEDYSNKRISKNDFACILDLHMVKP